MSKILFFLSLDLTFPNIVRTWRSHVKSVLVIHIHDRIIIRKLQVWYIVCSDGCVVDEVKWTRNPYFQYSSIINYWANSMILSLRNNTTIIKSWLCVNYHPRRTTNHNCSTHIMPLKPMNTGWHHHPRRAWELGDLQEVICLCCWVLEHDPPYAPIFIDIIKHLIHPRLFGVTQSHQIHEWLE